MSEVGEPKGAPARSPWSFRLLTVAGIPIRINVFFVLLLIYIGVTSGGQGGPVWVAFVVAIFACVLLHELGHALVARRFGIETKDITLYPIGGVAMLASRPKAKQEFWIALAGPAVNVVLALILAVVMVVSASGIPAPDAILKGSSFLGALLVANLSLALFNMVPAFPMDGGRVLRALLAIQMPEARATQIAAGVGQGLAILLGFVGLMIGNPILMFIAFFVFVAAGQEVQSTVARSFMEGHAIQDAMERRFRTINSGSSLEFAAQQLLDGAQRDFPVVVGEGGDVVGVLTRDDVARGLARGGPSAYVAGHMRREFRTAAPDVPLEAAIDMFGGGDQTPILIMDDGKLAGMVTQENLSEFIVLAHARQQRRG